MVVGQENQVFAVIALHFHLVLHNVVVFLGFLLLKADLLDFFHKRIGAAIQDRHFGTIQLDEAVVDAAGIECCHCVFDGADFDVALHQHCAALGVAHQVGIAIDDRFAFYVCALNLISVILFCRIEHRGDELSGVKSFAL